MGLIDHPGHGPAPAQTSGRCNECETRRVNPGARTGVPARRNNGRDRPFFSRDRFQEGGAPGMSNIGPQMLFALTALLAAAPAVAAELLSAEQQVKVGQIITDQNKAA